jgi:hypothetical protein
VSVVVCAWTGPRPASVGREENPYVPGMKTSSSWPPSPVAESGTSV